jgi:hypothetical protein
MEESKKDLSTVPPDGGFGWVVTIAAGFVQLFVIGNIYAFGVMYPVYLDEFGAPEGETAWIGSIGAALK